jgi:hypothetical protein
MSAMNFKVENENTFRVCVEIRCNDHILDDKENFLFEKFLKISFDALRERMSFVETQLTVDQFISMITSRTECFPLKPKSKNNL